MTHAQWQPIPNPIDTGPTKRKRKWPIIVTVVVCAFLLLCGGGTALLLLVPSDKAGQVQEFAPTLAPEEPATGLASKSATPTVQKTTAKPSPAAVPVPVEPVLSAEQQNAITMAEDYLDYQAFSRSGLIKQLVYEGFTKSVATKAVDSLKINYKEQASETAKAYLDYQSFSRSGLIKQLEYEGYTHAQAVYGADQVM
jgi:hypothetical protein